MPKPDNVGVGVAVAVINKMTGRILLLYRKGAHASNKWACPGGWIEATDKSPEDTGVRELLEEVGIVAKPKELQLLTITSEWHEAIQTRSITLYYLMEYDPDERGEPEIREKDKASHLHWSDPFYVLEHRDSMDLFPKLEEALVYLA